VLCSTRELSTLTIVTVENLSKIILSIEVLTNYTFPGLQLRKASLKARPTPTLPSCSEKVLHYIYVVGAFLHFSLERRR
jgi:hypothetical protein